MSPAALAYATSGHCVCPARQGLRTPPPPLKQPRQQARMGQAEGPPRVSQPGPSLGKGLPIYTARRGTASHVSSQAHLCPPEFLSQVKRLSGSSSLRGLEAVFGGHQRDSGPQEWVFLASCDCCGRQWRITGCGQAPAMALSSLEESILLFLVSFVSLSSVSSLIFFYPVLTNAGWPRKSGKQCACPQLLPWAYIAQVSLSAHLSRDGTL